MKSSKVTIRDVAAKAGVSPSTVSMILNGSSRFPEQTCRKVVDACNELGYVRGELLRTESNRESKALVAVVPTLSNLFFVKAVGAMQRRAKELGYSLLVFETGEEFLKAMDTDLFQKIVTEMDKVNVHPINCSFVGGMRHVIGKAPYVEPADIKGLKLRVPASTTYLECFEAIGASPMGMPASDQLSALSAGTIDALDQSISLMYSTKSYELVDKVTLLAQQPLADALFCSTNWWNSIPEEYRVIIEEELHNAGLRYNEYSVENEGRMREEMEAAGVEFFEADRDAYKELAGDLVLKYSIGQELLDTLAEIRAAA